MTSTLVKVEDVVRGDVIVEGNKRITVKAVDRLPDHCPYHVHINGALCWDAGSLVTVDRGE